MKVFIVNIFFITFFISAKAQKNYWQQKIKINLQATLNTKEKTINVFEKIHYTNHSNDTLHFIWLYAIMNAYKSDTSMLSDELLKNRKTNFYFSDDEQRGGITKLDFLVDETKTKYEYHHKYAELLKVYLPKPLLPNATTIIETPFICKLPYNFTHIGYINNDFAVVHWYLKPAVYNSFGWHLNAYTEQADMYSEFVDYDVNITLPSNFIVASSGNLITEAELNTLKTIGKQKIENQNNYKNKETFEPERDFFLFAKPLKKEYLFEKVTKTINYTATNAKDFAWFASPNFLVTYDTIVINDKVFDCFNFFTKSNTNKCIDNLNLVKSTIQNLCKNLGTNSFGNFSVVTNNKSANNIVKTFSNIGYINNNYEVLNKQAVKEVVVNQFIQQNISVNSNVSQWLVSGLTNYLLNDNNFFTVSNNNLNIQTALNSDDFEMLNEILLRINKAIAIDSISINNNELYFKLYSAEMGSLWFKKLAQLIGEDNFEKTLKEYYKQYLFKHVTVNDFKSIVQKNSSSNTMLLFNQLNKNSNLISGTKRTLKPLLALPFSTNLSNYKKYNYVNFTPSATYNYYDGIRPGLLIHNYQISMPKFHFALNPSYGTSSSQFNFFGRIAYNVYKKDYWLELSASYQNHNYNNFRAVDNAGKVEFNKHLSITRFVPHLKLTLYNNDLSSTQRTVIGFKTFYLHQQFLNYNSKTDNSVYTIKSYVNRLYINKFDNKVLYPYHINLVADQTKDLLRLSLTAKQFFNYAKFNGGIHARFFAGKILYWQPRNQTTQFRNYSYWFNLLGTKGEDDYTFSDYFVGRHELQRGWMGQQIMERDGYFKMRMDYTSPVGRTDDWLMAANFNIDMPDYPLFKLFADVGTYAEAWKDNPATGRFLYTAGIQLSLFNNVVNIYAPLLNSTIFNNHNNLYLTNNKFAQSVSFSINLQNLHFNKLFPQIPL